MQKALRTRETMIKPEDKNTTNACLHADHKHGITLSDGTWISHKKMEGHIAYDIEFEGRWHAEGNKFKYYLMVDYIYSSTCPCSFELAHDAKEKRDAAQANRLNMSLKDLGKKFKDTILSLGGSFSPLEVFKLFRGREPNPDALLRHSGLI